MGIVSRGIPGLPTGGPHESAKELHTEKSMNGGELWMSVMAPDVPLSALELKVVEATQEEVPRHCSGWKDISKAPKEEEKPMKWSWKRLHPNNLYQ